MNARWRKSSYSGNEPTGGCVEVAQDLAAVRDSKNPDGPVLSVDARALLEWCRSHYF
jgi:uncharacterized protein DUF397